MNKITAEDFGLLDVEIDCIPSQIKIGEIICTLIKCELLEKSMLNITYNYIIPNPINFLNISVTL